MNHTVGRIGMLNGIQPKEDFLERVQVKPPQLNNPLGKQFHHRFPGAGRASEAVGTEPGMRLDIE